MERPAAENLQHGWRTYKTAEYGGCGCAGGEVVTLTDEVGRRQKVYSDSLGRAWKTEVLGWNGSVYSTTANTLNARDQATLVRQTDNATGVYQDTTMTFDGYGRLQSTHVPEQNAGAATTYSYNNDDTINSVTDARGASATYGYNNRHLVTGITYNAPAGITATPNISYSYDAAGNRTSMSDGLGSKSYSYNQLSQMTSETRTFNGVSTFTLSYDYNLGGELKRITDATNMTINYSFDSVGRLSGVTGSDSLYANVSNYASNFQYRAWGGLKSMTDGTNHTLSLLNNSKLQPTHFEISGSVVSQNYDYNNDGRISFVHNTTDVTFDRSYFYDHMGRLTEARTGGQARGDSGTSPYYETFAYDALSNLTARQSDSWNGQTSNFDSATYTNNRRVGWGYDADGRNTTIGTRSYTFNAAGQQILMSAQQVMFNGNHITVNETSGYDGDGQRVYDVASGQTTYYLTSSILGGAIIEELNNSGQKNVGYVYSPGGQLLAKQSLGYPSYQVTWKHSLPTGTGQYETYSNSAGVGRTEFDPLGADLQLEQPPDPPPSEGEGDIGAGHFGGIMDARWTDFFNVSGGCTIDGMAASCSSAMSVVNSGAGVIGPANTTRWNANLNNGQGGYQFFHAWADGTQGWSPFGWVPGGSVGATHPNGPPTLKPNTPEAEARRRELRQIYGPSGFGNENVDLRNSSDYWFLSFVQNTLAATPQNTLQETINEKAETAASQKLIDNEDCRKFMQRLFNETRGEMIMGLPGNPASAWTGLNAYSAAAVAGRISASGKSGAHGDTTTYGETNNGVIKWNKEFYGLSTADAALQILHESLHLIPGFTDFAVASAAATIAGDPKKKFKDQPEASQYINEQIKKHCGG